ncbi:SUMO protease ULP1 [Sporobolomyces salmoneus]|uniref:SUMO protease ULP1 n=1 Tax=Sporobolomyces salmoneus TaxID=183962 RepID=UPI003172346C
MLGTKRPASTLDPPSTSSPSNSSKRLKSNRGHQSKPPAAPSAAPVESSSSWYSPILNVLKSFVATPSASSSTATSSLAASTPQTSSHSSRSRQKPLQPRAIYPSYIPTFRDNSDQAIWEIMTAKQRGEPPLNESSVLRHLRMRNGGNANANGTGSSVRLNGGAKNGAVNGTAGGYQRKKPMGSKENPSQSSTATSNSRPSRRRNRIPTPDFLRTASNPSVFEISSDSSPSSAHTETKRAQRSLYNFITESLPLTQPESSSSSSESSDDSESDSSSSRSPSSRSPSPPLHPANTTSNETSPPSSERFFSSPWLPTSLSIIRRKQHQLALRNRDYTTLESLRSLPTTPTENGSEERDQELRVYKEGVRHLIEQEDDQVQPQHQRATKPIRTSSSLLGPPSATYASILSSSTSTSKTPSKPPPTKPLTKVERMLEKYHKTQTESPAKREAELLARLDQLRLERDLEAQKALEELEPAVPVQRKRKWPRKVPLEIQDRVTAILRSSNYNKSITGGNVDVNAIRRLRPGTWLDDSIIAFYGVLINNRFLDAEKRGDLGKGEERLRKVWCFNSFFWNMYEENGYKRVKKWTKKFDVFEKDIIIFPINIRNSHWTCAAVNVKKKRFEYYDSLGNHMQKAHMLLRKWLQEEHECKKGGPIDLSDWEDYWDPDVPQQNNSNDCGVFTCTFMEILSREYEGFDFDQKQMPYLRQKIAYEIDKAELIPEEFE